MRVVAYSLEPWSSSMSVHRLVAPLRTCGIDLIRGNEGPDINEAAVDDADLVIIARDFPRLVHSQRQIVERARRAGSPIVYETDDLLIALPGDHPDCDTGYFDDAVMPMLEAIVDADAVTVTTRPLAQALRTLNPRVHVLPNYLIENLWMPRAFCGSEHRMFRANRCPLIIGYMGGGSHRPDMESIAGPLERVLHAYGDRIVLRMIGLAPPANLIALKNVEQLRVPSHLSRVDYAGFVSWFREQPFDILLGPLRDGLFNRCKSSIKFLEYAVTGAASLFSRVSPYDDAIEDGRTGLLASTSEKFEMQLRRLIDDAALRENLALSAMRHVRENHSISAHAHQWRDVYDQILRRGNRPRGPRSRMRANLISAATAGALRYQSRLRHEQDEAKRQVREIKNSRAWRLATLAGKLRFWR